MISIIQKIVNSPVNYAKFLNTLSLLEYIGARKILKSQSQQTIHESILSHAAEELRHAKILKKAAMNSAPDICSTYQEHELLCSKHAIAYFQTIDRSVHLYLNNDDFFQAYLITTYLIEQRAISLYRLLETVLNQINKTSPFRGILAEENQHLNEIIYSMNKNNISVDNLNALIKLEQKQFKNFMSIIENSI